MSTNQEDRSLHGWKPMDGGSPPSRTPGAKEEGAGVAVVVLLVGGGLLFLVAVVGILAAIAIPNFLAMQLRSKRAEAPANLASIRIAAESALTQGVGLASAAPCPEELPGRELRAWAGDCAASWVPLGWSPGGDVRCTYELLVEAGDPNDPTDDDFLARARCDVDGDSSESVYEATRAQAPGMVSANNVY